MRMTNLSLEFLGNGQRGQCREPSQKETEHVMVMSRRHLSLDSG